MCIRDSPEKISEEVYRGGRDAVMQAYTGAAINSASEIDWFGLYDCFPICFIRAVEAVGLASRGGGGAWVQDMYNATSETYRPHEFQVNTHGGLLALGAPWEVPAMYSIIEALRQLEGSASESQQLQSCNRALVYGNGGILTHTAVAILGTEQTVEAQL